MSEANTTQPPAWIADLPEGIRNDPSIASFKGDDWKTVGPVITQSLIETKAMVGRKGYEAPKDDWTPEKRKEWHGFIGVPETPDKYPMPDAALAEKAGLNKEVLDSTLKKFHEIGLTPSQTKALLNDWYIQEAVKGSEMQATQRAAEKQAAETTLKQEFGDKYQAKMGLVTAFLSKFADPEFVDWVNESGAGNNPKFAKTLIKAAEAMLEDSSHGGRAGQFGPASSKAQAIQAIQDMKLDTEFMKQFMSGNKEAVKKWNDLHNMAYSAAAA